jgi:hypothetical protein
MLLEAEAKDAPCEEGVTALGEAAIENRASVAQALIEHKSDINQHLLGINLLGWAIRADGQCSEILRVPLAAKPALDVNEVCIGGPPPLRSAVQRAQPEAVALLLQAGADPRQRDSNGATALMGATDVETVRHLVQAAPDTVNLRNDGQSAVSRLCVEAKTYDVLEALFRCAEEYGCPVDVSAEDDHGGTALHVAMMGSNLRAVKLLLEKGAGTRGSGYEGMTVLMRPFLSDADRQAGFSWYQSIIFYSELFQAVTVVRRMDERRDRDDEFVDEDEEHEVDDRVELRRGGDTFGDRRYNPDEDARARECVEAVIASVLRGDASRKKRKAVDDDKNEKETDTKRTKRW